jgi:hypothetical protein
MMQESHGNDVADDIDRVYPQLDLESATPWFPPPTAMLASHGDDARIQLEAQTLENTSAPSAHVLPQQGVAPNASISNFSDRGWGRVSNMHHRQHPMMLYICG